MTDHLIRCNDFIAKHDGSNDFSINRKTAVNKPVKDSVFSRKDLQLKEHNKVILTVLQKKKFSEKFPKLPWRNG